MFPSMIWLAGIVLESLLLIRSFRTRLVVKYPFFYAYSGAVLLMAILLLFPTLYHRWYWGTQFFTLILGYGILLEILNHALAPYPGAGEVREDGRPSSLWAHYVLCRTLPAASGHAGPPPAPCTNLNAI